VGGYHVLPVESSFAGGCRILREEYSFAGEPAKTIRGEILGIVAF